MKREAEAAGVPVADGAPVPREQPVPALLDGALQAEDKRSRQCAILFTCVLFTILSLVTLPRARVVDPDPFVPYVPPLDTFVPPVAEPPRVERQTPEEVRRVPLPDPMQVSPEPAQEPTPAPDPEARPPESRLVLGPPRAPRGQRAPVAEGLAGLIPPVVIENVEPQYPPMALRWGVEGTVVIRAVITTRGSVGPAEVVAGIGRFGMDEAALEAVQQRRYTPGLLEGRPVAVVMTVRVSYVLRR